MSGMFIKPEETLKAEFFVAYSKTIPGKMYAATDKKFFADNKDADTSITENHFVVVRRPTYRDDIAVASAAISSDMATMTVDPAKLRYERFVRLVIEWSLKDEKGIQVEVNRANIDTLNPALANVIVDAVDNELNKL